MEILLDGSVSWRPPQETPNLRELLLLLDSHLLAQGRVIIRLQLDGGELDRPRQQQLGGESPARFQKLEVESADPGELSQKTLAGLREHLDRLAPLHQESARKVRGGDYENGIRLLQTCFGGWDMIVRTVGDVVRLCRIPMEESPGSGPSTREGIARLQETLTRFRKAFTEHDLVTVADIAEYELPPAVEQWRTLLQDLSIQIATRRKIPPA